MGDQGAAAERTALQPGEEVDHFRVVRLLGRGGMAEVYLARDGLLGRKVALKVVRPDALGTRDAVDRFLFEARATARFNHPNIVTVYAVGVHEGRPYVALEYLEGQSLRARMEDSPPGLREALRIGHAVAEALVEAHRHEILHRDLKPDNVLIPRDGRVRVVDFGLAKRLGESDDEGRPTALEAATAVAELAATVDSFESGGGGIRGTPLYMAPEQWTGGELSGATDVWALGLLLYELVAGRAPYRASSVMELASMVCDPEPAPSLKMEGEARDDLARLVAQCLAKAPGDRPTAREAAEALAAMLHPSRRPSLHDEESPFPGLLAFSERQADLFFGRDAEIAEVIERAREQTVLPVVGPSGAGKSSFVQAGLIPRLREAGPLLVLRVRPGAHPLRALASKMLRGESTLRDRTVPTVPAGPVPAAADSTPPPELETLVDEELRLAEELRASPGKLNLLLRRIAEAEGSRVLLVADQLEELHTLTDDAEARAAFMRALCCAADDPADPVRVVFTLRDDFLGALAEGPEVREALSRVVLLRSPGPSALEEILTRPLEATGYQFDDPALVPEMIGAVAGEPACLPLLQFATRTLWERRDRQGRLLLRAVYDAVGGVAGALATHADGVLESMSAEGVRVSRALLMRLVTPEGTRKALTRAALLEGAGTEAGEVLTRLVQARLLTVRRSRRGDQDGEAVVEIAHESLIRSWRRLSRWIDESREEIAFLAEAAQAAELWARRGRRDEELWSGEALHEAQKSLERCASAVPEAVTAFLGAAIEREGERDRREARRRTLRTAALAGAAVLAAIVAFAFAQQSRRAEEAARATAVRWAEGELEGARGALLRGDLLEARGRLRGALEVVDSPLGRALWRRVSADPLLWSRDLGALVYSVAFSPDGRHLAAACQDRSLYLFDVATRQVEVLRGQGDQVFGLAWSPSGRRLVAGTWSGEVGLWDVETERVTLLPGHGDQVWSVAWSRTGERFATASHDGTAKLWNGETGSLERTLEGHGRALTGVAFSSDGRTVGTVGNDGTLRLWDPATGEERLRQREPGALALAFHPTEPRVAVAGHGRAVVIRDARTGQLLRSIPTSGGSVQALAWSPSGDRIAATGVDGRVRIYPADGGAPRAYVGGEGLLMDVAWSPSGHELATCSQEGVRLLDVDVPPPPAEEGGHEGSLGGVAFAPDGARVATASVDGTVRVWDVATGRLLRVLGGGAPLKAVAWSRAGSLLAWGGADRLVHLGDAGTGVERASLPGHGSEVNGLSFSPDGRLLASAGSDQVVRVWDLAERRQVALLSGHRGMVLDVAFSPDGARLASASVDGTVRVWPVEDGAEGRVLGRHDGSVWSVAWSPAGDRVLSTGEDGRVRAWDVESGAEVTSWERGCRVYGLAVAPGDGPVAAAGADGAAALLRGSEGATTLLRGHRGEVNAVVFDPAGRVLASVSDDGTLRLWDVSTGRPLWRAPVFLPTRSAVLTHAGWVGLGQHGASAPVGEADWARAAEERARVASASPSGDLLCFAGADGTVELWDLAEDRQVSTARVEELDRLVASNAGCVVLAGERVQLLGRSGSRDFSDRASEVFVDSSGILVVSEGRLVGLDHDGEPLAVFAAPEGLVAAARVGSFLAVGFEDGNVELYPVSTRSDRPARALQDTPSSPVESLAAGPDGTLAVGFASGHYGLWDLGTGGRLELSRLHGSAVHLDYREGTLRVATDLGQARAVDLATYELDVCALLEQLWAAVPAVWREGGAHIEPPHDDRGCRR